ncbi:MAG: Rrf2 family transcriptional regulator [Hyphomicrobiales bacterium]|nr:Rrf2 family transcriptional regulator [Hyphomicrobiales bacterium]MDE2115794.1 Rrf2 family transcriptional regulator [Hyphomicrobiales bacterium]
MRLTQFTDYTLRMLQLVALRAPHLITVDEVARAHAVSRAHMVKVAHQLSLHGYIETVRGRNGGMRLLRDPAKITIGEVVRWSEGSTEMLECFNAQTSNCPITEFCRLSVGVQQATRAFFKVLDGLTLADITANRKPLLSRLTPKSSLGTL